jgi:histidinol dehydrogenase
MPPSAGGTASQVLAAADQPEADRLAQVGGVEAVAGEPELDLAE